MRTEWGYQYERNPIVRCSKVQAIKQADQDKAAKIMCRRDDGPWEWVDSLPYLAGGGLTVQGPVYGGPPGSPE